jgi:parvulin-like peptidyl-prolyl isomerase
LVNDVPIYQSEFEVHYSRYLAAQAETGSQVGTDLAPEEAQTLVLQDMIDRLLLVQAAEALGYMVEADQVAERIEALTNEVGGEEALAEWQVAYGYTPETFQYDLALAIAEAWMRDQIAAEVPAVAQQVHARQILLYNNEAAQEVLEQLQTGTDFGILAQVYDPLGLGDLGWFPQGVLTEPAVEEAAFSLELGEISPIIETSLGFHIIQVIGQEDARLLDGQSRLTLQFAAIDEWLAAQRAQSDIQIYLDTS